MQTPWIYEAFGLYVLRGESSHYVRNVCSIQHLNITLKLYSFSLISYLVLTKEWQELHNVRIIFRFYIRVLVKHWSFWSFFLHTMITRSRIINWWYSWEFNHLETCPHLLSDAASNYYWRKGVVSPKIRWRKLQYQGCAPITLHTTTSCA